MWTGLSPTDGRDLDGGSEEALFFPFALRFLDLVSRGVIGDPITVAAASARTSLSPVNHVSLSELKSSGDGLIPDVLPEEPALVPSVPA